MNHNKQVSIFLEQCKIENPDLYKDVCSKYPTLSSDQWKTVRGREVPVGLLGIAPAHISPHVAAEHNVESVYAKDEQ